MYGYDSRQGSNGWLNSLRDLRFDWYNVDWLLGCFWVLEKVCIQYHLVFFHFFIKIDKKKIYYLDTDMAFFIIILVAMSILSVPTKYIICHVGSFH